MRSLKMVLIGFTAVFGLFLGATAHPVDQETAKAIAVKFMKTSDLETVACYRTEQGANALYVFNTTNGFVIVSADDCETPIIGYSLEGRFDPNNVPVQMEDYLQDFVSRIQYGMEHYAVADETTARQWELVKTTGRLNDNKTATAVVPLLGAKWGQGCFYNNACPNDEQGPCGHKKPGCVAVAMAQIMHYWKHPETGWDSCSYVYGNFPISANFANTVYKWETMPNSLNEGSYVDEVNAVATLLFHCSASVNTNFYPNSSQANSYAVPDALMHYFKYSRDLYGESRDANDEAWLAKLKDCLDMGRPVFYSGHGSIGHAFVCDGYDSNDMLHFNWGWDGVSNGYFALGNLNPNGYGFNDSHYAIFDIAPNLELYQVSASIDPPEGGIVEGCGGYPVFEQCTLTAVPTDNHEFLCWKKDGILVSYFNTYSMIVQDDIDNLEACFTLKPVRQVTADTIPDGNGNANMMLSWGGGNDKHWHILKQFGISDARGVASDGEYIYTCRGDSKGPMFTKYTMEGDFVESFDVTGCNYPSCLTYDGQYFYCNGLNDQTFYTVDLTNKTLINSIPVGFDFEVCTHQAGQAFLVNRHLYNKEIDRIVLMSSSGEILAQGPYVDSGTVAGSGLFVEDDGKQHLLLKDRQGLVFHVYEKTFQNILTYQIDRTHPIMDCGESHGSWVGKYQGTDAMFVIYDDCIKIYEIVNVFAQCKQYRLYRSDEHGNLTVIADSIAEASYIDATWKDLDSGLYRYGVCSVFTNGNESNIVWSAPIAKGNYDVEDHQNPLNPNVHKVFENGQIVIIKDGKRYNIKGQEIK